jgi:plastocyanin
MRERTNWLGVLLVGCLLLLLVPLAAAGATHNVSQVGLTFSPDTLYIGVGDTVIWSWASGPHTVTNGTGAIDPNVGNLFDAPLDSGNPTFQYTFTSPGTVPYFCRIHEGSGMKGVVFVLAPVPTLSPKGVMGLLASVAVAATLLFLRRRRLQLS